MTTQHPAPHTTQNDERQDLNSRAMTPGGREFVRLMDHHGITQISYRAADTAVFLTGTDGTELPDSVHDDFDDETTEVGRIPQLVAELYYSDDPSALSDPRALAREFGAHTGGRYVYTIDDEDEAGDLVGPELSFTIARAEGNG